MNILFCIFTCVVFPQTGTIEIITQTSLNAWTFTPRYSIEPYPGYQVFLVTRLCCSYPFLSDNRISLGVDAGFANRFDFTYFYSYSAWGINDATLWLMFNKNKPVNLLARVKIPTASYNKGLGTGAYHIELYARRVNIMRNCCYYIGYEWIGANSDKINYGDKFHFGLEINDWLRIGANYAFSDKSTYYELHDSPSLTLETCFSKDFRVLKVYRLRVVLSQTIMGRDIPISTSILLRISKQESRRLN
jgi:hypothetical protein